MAIIGLGTAVVAIGTGALFLTHRQVIFNASSVGAPAGDSKARAAVSSSVPFVKNTAGLNGATAVVDDPPQVPLDHRPAVVRAIYLTSWSAGLASRVDMAVRLAQDGKINAAVVDIKDASGDVAYLASDPGVTKYHTVDVRIPRINAFIKRLHEAGIYVIARITAFQDPALAKADPALAIHRRVPAHGTSSVDFNDAKTIWTDDRGLAWIDPSSRAAWAYLAALGSDATSRGFDEINYDYVRFPSNGDLASMVFPSWDGREEKHLVIRSFFQYLRERLSGKVISLDLFGFVTVRDDDLGIGQKIEDALAFADYVCPMAYPSLYDAGFLGYLNPAKYPYEVVKYSMQGGLAHAMALAQGTTAPKNWYTASSSVAAENVSKETLEKLSSYGKLRPWLQAFDLHSVAYTASMVEKEIRATQDALGQAYAGYMLWDPTNNYAMLR